MEPGFKELLGEIYAKGAGVERSNRNALEWLWRFILNAFLAVKMVAMYGSCGEVSYATQLFDRITQPSIFWCYFSGCGYIIHIFQNLHGSCSREAGLCHVP